MFRIGTQRLAWMDVKWTGIDDDGYEVENECEIRVQLVDRSEILEQLAAEDAGGAETKIFADKVTRNWKHVGDEDGKEMPFTPENFALLWEAPGFAAAWGERYLKLWHGQGKVREKNSQNSAADGPGGDQKTPTA